MYIETQQLHSEFEKNAALPNNASNESLKTLYQQPEKEKKKSLQSPRLAYADVMPSLTQSSLGLGARLEGWKPSIRTSPWLEFRAVQRA